MEWTTLSTLGRVGIATYQNRALIQEWWTRALAYIDKGHTNILVTGRPGVGKSILVAQMHGHGREANFTPPKQSTKTEVNAVTLEKWTKLVRTLPGQSSQERALGIRRHLQENENLEGLIHVVDFGYTTPRDNEITSSLILQNQIKTTEDLRKYNLANEAREVTKIVSEIETSILTKGSPKWLVIAVNKIDLFKDNLNDALIYYHPRGQSEFGKQLVECQHRVGSNKLPIYIVPVCAYEHDFEWNSELTPSQLQRQEEREILRDFMQVIAAISEQHSK